MNDPLKNPGRALTEKELDRIKAISSSEAGDELRRMADSESLRQAAAKGDVETLKNAVTRILKTDEGARLAKRISDMMNGK